MNLCDGNVWLSLALSRHVHQPAARTWIDGIAEPQTILFCRATQQTLLRLLTKASVLAPYGNPPLTNREAWGVYEAFACDDRIAMRADEPAGLQERWAQLAVRDTVSPKLWMDAYLAAFALTAGCQLVTTDAGFRQFPGLDLLVLA